MDKDRQQQVVATLASLSLFADLKEPQLEAVLSTFDEARFSQGERVLRQGISGSAFYVIIDGQASVQVDGAEAAQLQRGDFFGEISILLGQAPVADVVALTPLLCLVLPGEQVHEFLTGFPDVMFRMLQSQARRLRNTNERWRS